MTAPQKTFPLLQNGKLKPALKILTDYPRDDLASDEVRQALVSACALNDVDFYALDVGAIPGMNTVVAGFKTAQLAMNSTMGFGHIVHTNCAPRRNMVSKQSKGEGVIVGMLPSGVALLTVNSGFSLAPIAGLAKAGVIKFFKTKIPDAGSQFRSRDYFPGAMAELARFFVDRFNDMGADKIAALIESGETHRLLDGFALLGEPIEASDMNELPEGAIYYIDNFGNMKLNLNHDRLMHHHPDGTEMTLAVGDVVVNATVGSAGFSQGEGAIALTRGSSGWTAGGTTVRFTEIFLRGGSAAGAFGLPKVGAQVNGLPYADLQRVFNILRDSNLKRVGPVDLYHLSEARLITYLADRGLITDGFNVTELRRRMDANTLLDALK